MTLRKLAVAGAAALAAFALPGTAAAAPPSAGDLFRDLGVDSVAAAYVVVVDTSSSMAISGVYDRVKTALPRFLDALSPQDLVSVVTFDTGASTTVPLGPPDPDLELLPATGLNTDFGVALEKAADELAHAPADVRVGGIVLLSDGNLDAPADGDYCDLDSPGWTTLREKFAELGADRSITGYGLQFAGTADRGATRCDDTQPQDEVVGVGAVLHAILPAGRVELQSDGNSALPVLLDRAKDGARTAKAVALLREDAGAGVTASVAVPAGQLDLSAAGGTPVAVTLRTAARYVGEVTVTGLTVTAAGLPAKVTGLPAEVQLKPDEPATVQARLEWTGHRTRAFLGGTDSFTGTLQVSGEVSSPWTAVVHRDLGYPDFGLGRLTAAPAPVHGGATRNPDLKRWAAVALPVAAVLAALGWLLLRRFPLLWGTLYVRGLGPAERDGHLRLFGWRRTGRLSRLIGAPGRVVVRPRADGELSITVARSAAGQPLTSPVRSGTTVDGRLIRVSVGIRHLRQARRDS
jgi:hypothetical protein